MFSKAVEGHRSPRRSAQEKITVIRASVLECASPLALFRMAVNSASNSNRALALDALRGLAILAMLLSGQMPFDSHALPSWMYHAQEPPPTFQFQANLPGT